jgi:selenocysteine-specific elongation factor
LRSALERRLVFSRLAYLGEEALLESLVTAMNASGRLRLAGSGVALVGRGPQLSAGERQVLAWLIERFRDAGVEPPAPEDCRREAPKNQESVPALISLAVANGDLVEISPAVYLHAATEQRLRENLAQMLSGGEGMTLSQIREALHTTRKYAVPICEYLDRTGFTRRDGDLRFLAKPSG